MNTRQKAKAQALDILADRVSIADRLTKEQQDMINNDRPSDVGMYETYNTLVDKPITGLDDLVGRILYRVERLGDDELRFYLTKTQFLRMYHIQDCCENVEISDINGDLDDLIGTPILLAEESVSGSDDSEEEEYSFESTTWTFYRFRTIKGSVDIRWVGSSNGYYSESVDIEVVNGDEE